MANEDTPHFLSDLELQLVHDTFPIFKKIQSINIDTNRKQNKSKDFQKETVGQYCSIIKEALDDLEVCKNRLERSLAGKIENSDLNISLNEKENDELSRVQNNYNKLLTYQQLLSLAGIIFFQLEPKNTSPGPVFSAWANYSYKEVISNMILNLEGFGGSNTNHFSSLVYCILTNRISDARNMIKIFRSKITSSQHDSIIVEGYNLLDSVLMNLDMILSDSISYNNRIAQFQKGTVNNALTKLINDYKSSEINDEGCELAIMPILALKMICGKFENGEIREYLKCSSVDLGLDNSEDSIENTSETENLFLTPWFFEFLYEILFCQPGVKGNLLHELTTICENLVYDYQSESNSHVYNILEVLTIRLVSFDIIGFCDTFCQYNSCWLIAFLALDLLYHSNLNLPDCPNPEDYFYKRREIGLELVKSIRNVPENLAIILEYLINVLDDGDMVIVAVEKILNSRKFIEDLNEKERIKVFHLLLNHGKLPKKIAEKYSSNVGKRLAIQNYATTTDQNDHSFTPDPTSSTTALQWSIRSNQIPQIESQLLSNIIEKSENFESLLKNCENFNTLVFPKVTNNSIIIESLLKYGKSGNLKDLISILNTNSSELKINIKLDILIKIQNNFKQGGDQQAETSMQEEFSKSEMLSLMKLANSLMRTQELKSNDRLKKFLVSLVQEFGRKLSQG